MHRLRNRGQNRPVPPRNGLMLAKLTRLPVSARNFCTPGMPTSKYAWGHDELRPLTKTARDWYGPSLLMTPVDALDTMT